MRKSLSLLGLGLLVLFLISTMQVGAYSKGPIIIPPPGGGHKIPVKVVGCGNKSPNFEGYVVGFNDSGTHGFVNTTTAIINIPGLKELFRCLCRYRAW